MNRKAVELSDDIRNKYANEFLTIVITVTVRPHGDEYNPIIIRTADEASTYLFLFLKILIFSLIVLYV